jgi:hypothetical protein
MVGLGELLADELVQNRDILGERRVPGGGVGRQHGLGWSWRTE